CARASGHCNGVYCFTFDYW
nr:immunoglobulin heavy chain junction region [Macaca mulatta]MOV38740.1 immunoglobulin heavy chain junction region [Macaca mulatta]MOV38884.1 immunoglobulin heavy chain junction region [Macaca mulatta]MOV40717.1 immunoglobulin heavy chain junction region [Macaca mulatta]MOV40841.1 immunoglobulin heavy chain junction region [Macaca mulatta]